MTNRSNYEKTKDRVLVENTAQGVYKYLTELDSNRKDRHTRWIWELLQNARDVSASTDDSLTAEIRYNPGEPGEQGELVFLHDGRGFKMDEIVHLIFYGSTKHENPDAIGQFGSGFLTTHLLSWEIEVSGLLDNGQWFDFLLARKPESVSSLYESMEQAGADFNESLTLTRPESIPVPFTTRFVYSISDRDAAEAVDTGLETLKQCAPYVVVFNKEFSSISIKTPDETHCFEIPERPALDASGIPQQITVTENKNENSHEREYLLATGTENTSVAVPLKSDDDSSECLPIEKTPRLFLGFPLVGTEGFSFPAVINSFNFTALENRDGVPLGQSNNQTNFTNQAVIEEASTLLIKMLQFAGSKGWHHVHLLANLPSIQTQSGLNTDWLKESIHLKFIEDIRQTPAVFTRSGKPIEPNQSLLPVAETDKGIKSHWDLLNDWHGVDAKLPRRDEAVGWYKAIESWSKIFECEVSELGESTDGEKLAREIHNISLDQSTGTHWVSNLKLKEGISVVNWLDRVIGFLKNNGLGEVIDKYYIVPNQTGLLFPSSSLLRDVDIDEELKSIADKLEIPIRSGLRDTRLNSLTEVMGRGYIDPDSVASKLIEELKNKAQGNIDDKFKDASPRLFAWIVLQKNYSVLRGYPVFTADGKSVRYLPSSIQDDAPPLAPIRAWPESLREFSGHLFPKERILADAFFDVLPDPEAWKHLDQQGLIKGNVIIQRDETDFKLLSPEVYGDDKDHETTEPVRVTDFVERVAIMKQVRDGSERALQFWKFLTEWLIKENGQGLEIKEAKCRCGAFHKYYPAAWLETVRNYAWIRQGKLRVKPSAQSLANLLRNTGWKPNPLADKLLSAIDDTLPAYLRFELVMSDPEERNALVNMIDELHQASGGDVSQMHAVVQHVQKVKGGVSQILGVLQHMQEDEKFPEYLAERQEQTRRAHENQRLGAEVEKLVRENLEDEGFSVSRTGTGSDFEIRLNVTQDDRSWLIEVKSTRTEGDYQSVRMHSTQAQTAEKKGENFLLCVVPIPENTEPDLETVRKKMLFVKNMGNRVAPLCEKLKQLKKVQTDITGEESFGVKLIVDGGKASILVKKSVWEEDGFQLEKLVEKLKSS